VVNDNGFETRRSLKASTSSNLVPTANLCPLECIEIKMWFIINHNDSFRVNFNS
jgi:hypothetical protein